MTSIYFLHSFTGIPGEFSSRMGDLRRNIGAISGVRVLDSDTVGVVASADLVVAITDHDSYDLQIALHSRKSLKKPLLMFYPRSRADSGLREGATLYSSDVDITDNVDAYIARRDPLRETLRVVC